MPASFVCDFLINLSPRFNLTSTLPRAFPSPFIVDILIIPVGGTYTIDSKDAVSVVQAIEPSIVIPMHYQAQGLSQEVFSKLAPVDDFLKEVGLSAERMPKLVVKREEINPEVQKVVVLERK